MNTSISSSRAHANSLFVLVAVLLCAAPSFAGDSLLREGPGAPLTLSGLVEASCKISIGGGLFEKDEETKSKTIKVPVHLHVHIEGKAPLLEGERESFHLSGEEDGRLRLALRVRSPYDYRIVAAPKTIGTTAVSPDAKTRKSLLGDDQIIEIVPSVLIVVERMGRKPVWPENEIAEVTGQVEEGRLVLRWSDPGNDSTEASTRYRIIVKRHIPFWVDPKEGEIEVDAAPGSEQQVSVDHLEGKDFVAGKTYRVWIAIKRVGPLYKDVWKRSKKFTVRPAEADEPLDADFDDLSRTE